MTITRHTSINRCGKYEYPVTIRDDNGRLFDAVLMFDKIPSVATIEAAAIAYVTKIKTAEATPPDPAPVPISEIEAILKQKNLMEAGETWDTWKTKAVVTKGK